MSSKPLTADISICPNEDIEPGQRKVVDYYYSMNGKYTHSVYLVNPSVVEYLTTIENTAQVIEILLTTKYIGSERKEL